MQRRRQPFRCFLSAALCWGLALGLIGLIHADATAPASDTPAPILPPAAAIASAHPAATAAGIDTLAAGGNAFDAAVAVSAALGVVEPYSAGLGGGGFWLLHVAAERRDIMLDSRERAPLAATRDLYLDADGEFQPALARDGALAAGIPGVPAALAHLATHYGRLPLATSLAPAIALARDGFAVDAVYRRLATWRHDALLASPAAAAVFLADGQVPALGHLIRQPDLATTLTRLAEQGHAGFYAGPTAAALVAGVQAAGGIWTAADLAAYQVVERQPISFTYRDARIVSAAPPSSGGVALAQMLHMLAGFDLAALTPVERVHLLAEVMRRAYRDRADYLGDPDQVAVPVARLTHPYYAAGLARDIDLQRAGAGSSFGIPASVPAGEPAAVSAAQPPAEPAEGMDTTHFSILDRHGNRVAATLSINYPFGAGLVAPGTGVLLNDEMDDFSAKPGVPNVYGLIGGEANAIAPGKRMLSSMSPTFIEAPGRVIILGTPGGSRIITMVLQGILAATDPDATVDPAPWVAAPRFHHQFLPDEILYEPAALSPPLRQGLEARGHRLTEASQPYGNMQVVVWDHADGRVFAASDPRGIGAVDMLPTPANTAATHPFDQKDQP